MAVTFSKTFLTEDLRKKRGGESAFVGVAAFGKHPGWQDFMDRLGIESESLLLAADLLDKGILKNYEAVWGERAMGSSPEEFALKSRAIFEFYLLWQRGAQCILGRIWKSGDRTPTGPRSAYPMALLAHIEAPASPAIIAAGVEILDKARAQAIATRSDAEVGQILKRCRQDLKSALSALREKPSSSFAEEQVAHFKAAVGGATGSGLEDVFYEFGNKTQHLRDKESASRAAHFRFSAGSEDPAAALGLWSRFCNDRLPADVPRLLVFAPDARHVDIVLGQPEPGDFSFLRYLPAAIPMANQIGFSLDPDIRAAAQSYWARFGKAPRSDGASAPVSAAQPTPAHPPGELSQDPAPRAVASRSKVAVAVIAGILVIGGLMFALRPKSGPSAQDIRAGGDPTNQGPVATQRVQTLTPPTSTQVASQASAPTTTQAFIRVTLSNAVDAALSLDGQAIALSESIAARPGDHELAILPQGWPPSSRIVRRVSLDAGKTNSVIVRVPETTLIVQPSVSHAVVTLNGSEIGRGSVTNTVKPGEAVIVVTATNHSTVALTTNVPPGETTLVRAFLSETPATNRISTASFEARGYLMVQEPARVESLLIDGKAQTNFSSRAIPLEPGDRTVVVRTASGAAATNRLNIVAGKTNEIAPPPALARVALTSNLRNVRISADGKELGLTPLTNTFSVGPITFVAEHANLPALQLKTNLEERAIAHEFVFAFAQANLSSAPANAEVYVNGKPVGRTPLQGVVLPPGEHRFVFSLGGTNITNSVLLDGKKVESLTADFAALSAPLEPKRRTNELGIALVLIPEKSIWVSEFEITEKQFISAMPQLEVSRWASVPGFPRADFPITRVEPAEVMEFVGKLSQNSREGRSRLPTIEEFAFIAEGATNGTTSKGRAAPLTAPAPVGSSGDRSSHGVSDAFGNVAEFCLESSSSPAIKVAGYAYNQSVLSPRRFVREPEGANEFTGFRVVIERAPTQQPK